MYRWVKPRRRLTSEDGGSNKGLLGIMYRWVNPRRRLASEDGGGGGERGGIMYKVSGGAAGVGRRRGGGGGGGGNRGLLRICIGGVDPRRHLPGVNPLLPPLPSG